MLMSGQQDGGGLTTADDLTLDESILSASTYSTAIGPCPSPASRAPMTLEGIEEGFSNASSATASADMGG